MTDPRWVACRARLWPDGTATPHQRDAERLFTGGAPFAAWLALVGDDVAGFAETERVVCFRKRLPA